MVCYHPIHAYYPLFTTTDFHSGESKRFLKFQSLVPGVDYDESLDFASGSLYYDYVLSYDDSFERGVFSKLLKPVKTSVLQSVPKYIDIKLPCGKCIGCQVDKARDYATRSIHEERMFNYQGSFSSFVTLTFNDEMLEHRPVHNFHSVYRHELQSFIKRLRERVYDKYKIRFRVMACGEYGEKHLRPHYHLLIFGFNFPDKYPFSFRGDIVYYRSPFLEKLWCPPNSDKSYGFSVIGDVTPASCYYVSKYCTKKIFQGDLPEGLEKSFLYTPHRPGLGFDYFMKFYKEIYSNKYCELHNGFKARIPKYYNSLLQKYDFSLYEKFKLDNLDFLVNNLFVEHLDLSTQRLQAREELQKLKCEKSIRSYEELSNLHNIY